MSRGPLPPPHALTAGTTAGRGGSGADSQTRLGTLGQAGVPTFVPAAESDLAAPIRAWVGLIPRGA